jgi:type III restriction enzyme
VRAASESVGRAGTFTVCLHQPSHHWWREEGAEPEKRPGRRPAIYYSPDPVAQDSGGTVVPRGTAIELKLVSLIRSRVKEWRTAGYPGVTSTTLELLNYWRRDGRGFRFFFAQLEAAETIVFLNEARRDLTQGIDIPLDEPSEQQKSERDTRRSGDTPARWPRALARPP